MISLLVVIVSIDICLVFLGYIYGLMNVIEVLYDVLFMFVVIVLDDGLFGKQGFGIVKSWQVQNILVELYVYEKGEYGFGVGCFGIILIGIIFQFIVWLVSYNF